MNHNNKKLPSKLEGSKTHRKSMWLYRMCELQVESHSRKNHNKVVAANLPKRKRRWDSSGDGKGIGILIEDKEVVGSCMGGKPWKAGRFALSLRLSLWSEHLGLRGGEISQIYDPVADASYKDIWMATAKTNTLIYQDVFACIPNDLIHSRASLRQNVAQWKERLGHTTIDLGVAPQKLEGHQSGDNKDADPMERLQSVKGHLVSFPLEFMSQEDLRPVFNESEYYAAQVFH
ncbi:Phospholipase D zeta 1 [Dionaea muscipula]